MTCPTCFSYMEKIADSKEKSRIPASPVSSDYECEDRGKRWRYVRDEGTLEKIT